MPPPRNRPTPLIVLHDCSMYRLTPALLKGGLLAFATTADPDNIGTRLWHHDVE